MRTSKLTSQDIEEAEKAADDRKHSRAKGFSLMGVRDRGWGRLYELNGRDCVMIWGVKDELAADHLFKLLIDGKEYIFSVDEFQKWLRWA